MRVGERADSRKKQKGHQDSRAKGRRGSQWLTPSGPPLFLTSKRIVEWVGGYKIFLGGLSNKQKGRYDVGRRTVGRWGE